MSHLPRYASRSVSNIAWYTPEISVSLVIGSISITVAPAAAPITALPLLVVLAHETVRIVSNRRARAAARQHIRQRRQQLAPAPAEAPAPTPIRVSAVRLDQPPRELDTGR